MNLKKLVIGGVAVMTAGVFAAACSSGGGSKTYTLTSGSYAFDANPAPTITPDTCFGASDEAAIGALISGATFTVTAGSGTWSIGLPSSNPASGLIPPIAGTISGNTLAATGGPASLPLMSNCTLSIGGNIDGTLTADNQFNAALSLNVTGSKTVATSAGSCALLAGTTQWSSGFLTFPTLSNPSNGSCGVTLSGHVSKQ